VTSIDFNAAVPPQPSNPLKTQSQTSLGEYENASKKRKLKMVPNQEAAQEVSFVYCNDPVKVKREVYEMKVPEDRKEFLEMVRTFNCP
jgi:hypothetical protein